MGIGIVSNTRTERDRYARSVFRIARTNRVAVTAQKASGTNCHLVLRAAATAKRPKTSAKIHNPNAGARFSILPLAHAGFLSHGSSGMNAIVTPAGRRRYV